MNEPKPNPYYHDLLLDSKCEDLFKNMIMVNMRTNRLEMNGGSLGPKVKFTGHTSIRNQNFTGVDGQKEYLQCNIWTKI